MKVPEDYKEEDRSLGISIVGRPNVGKSSILNALVGEDRTIVSPVSGTTRDAIDADFTGPDGQVGRLPGLLSSYSLCTKARLINNLCKSHTSQN